MKQNKLEFVCGVAAPRSMYRILHKSKSPEQLITWRQEELGEYPMFTPVIVVSSEIRHTANAASDGLNRIWDGRDLILPRGARVVVGNTFKFKTGITGLLDFNLDENLSPGQFEVTDTTEDGFKFKVRLAPDLYRHLMHRRDELAGKNIMVNVVTAAFALLREKWSDDDESEGEGWQSFRNLVGLAELLEQKQLPFWADDNFRPERVATSLYPHTLPMEVQ